MVTETHDVANHHKILTTLISGSVASGMAKTAIAPLDRAKINFQVTSRRFTYKAVLRFLWETVSIKGVSGLWRGNSATLIRVVPFGAVQFMSHEQYDLFLEVDKHESTPFRRALAGSLAGATATAVTYPLDRARAQLAVSFNEGYLSILRKAVKVDGLLSLYRGFAPTLLGSALYSGISFFTYQTWKKARLERKPTKTIHALERFGPGGCSGLLGQACTYPLDIVRRRMQTGNAPRAVGTFHVARSVAHDEGVIKGLYKGLSLNFIKGPIANGISFAVNDSVKIHLRRLTYFHDS